MNSIDCKKSVINGLKDKPLITTDGKDRSGEKNPTYLIQDHNRIEDGHDLYCYGCHKSGNVIQCVECWRVFHSYCVEYRSNKIENPFICSICLELEKEFEGKVGTKFVDIEQMNELLGYVYNELTKNQEMADLITIKDDNPNLRQQLHHRIDISQILFKTKKNSYKKLTEFQKDFHDILHCMSLLHGTNGVVFGLAAQLFSDCIKELEQMKECVDCYRMSNQKKDKHWFCKPCDPLHEIVFAKLKGWPFWPAKVMRRDLITNECKVRFFGQFHEVSTVDNKNVKPIDTTLHQLRIINQSPQLTQALRELKKYQKNLLIASDTTAIRSKIRAASAKRPRRRADGTRPRKKSIKVEIKSENNNNEDQRNETSNDPFPPVIDPNVSSFLASQTTGHKQERTSIPELQINRKLSNAVTVNSESSPIEVNVFKRVVSRPPSTHQSFGAICPVQNMSSITSPQTSPVDIPRGRGRPKGIKNKSSLDKLNLEDLKTFEIGLQKLELKPAILTKELKNKSNDCNCNLNCCCKQKINRKIKKFEEKNKEDSKKLKKYLESIKQQNYRLLNDNKSLKNEFQRRDEFNALIEKHWKEIKELKKKQWCWHCGIEAIYFCCWNRSYCSKDCQKNDWITGHNKTCRRIDKRSAHQSAKCQAIDVSNKRKVIQHMINHSIDKIPIETKSRKFDGKRKSKLSSEQKKISIREEDEKEYLNIIKSQPNGWDKGFTPLEVIGINRLNESLIFLVKWTNQEESIVLSEIAKHLCPQLVIKFYEKHIVWGEHY